MVVYEFDFRNLKGLNAIRNRPRVYLKKKEQTQSPRPNSLFPSLLSRTSLGPDAPPPLAAVPISASRRRHAFTRPSLAPPPDPHPCPAVPPLSTTPRLTLAGVRLGRHVGYHATAPPAALLRCLRHPPRPPCSCSTVSLPCGLAWPCGGRRCCPMLLLQQLLSPPLRGCAPPTRCRIDIIPES
jgi:hypothetical protein